MENKEIPIPYFLTNKEWYYCDELGIYKLTDKAPPEAVKSYNKYYEAGFFYFDENGVMMHIDF